MATYTQENRLLIINTPLGPEELLLTNFRGTEGISQPFQFELDLISENHNIVFENIIGKNVTVSLLLADGEEHFFNGMISSFTQTGTGGSERAIFSNYSATMVPWLWLLTRTANIRIFQEKTIPEIIEQIFQDKGLTDYVLRLTGQYDKRTYCVQYRETDFNFISRLMEDEGIFYFFEHDNGKHTLVLADSPDEHKPCPNQKEARYHMKGAGGFVEEDVIDGMVLSKSIRSGKYALNDFNFETPNTKLLVEVDAKKNLSPQPGEIYDYPAEYGKRNEGERYAEIRMQEEEAQVTLFTGTSDVRAFASGFRFKLQDYTRTELNEKDYVLTRIMHQASEPYDAGGGNSSAYRNNFSCIPHDIPFRPVRITPKPIVEGVQTAIVVGAAGEEIYTDKHGRVKVQFHWDREGKADENSSCWIRVSQAWAGNGWGAIQIPRIGQEVIVDFIEGDPDRPIITGRVYHGVNKPPYELPKEATKSTVKSNSSKGGGGFNEIRFEDKKGEEEIFIHAEKNLDLRVKDTQKAYIGNENHLTIEKTQFEHYKENKHILLVGDQIEKVDGNIDLTLAGNRTSDIAGNEDMTLAGDSKTDIGGGKDLNIGGDRKDKVGGGFSLEVGADAMIKAGAKAGIQAGADIHIKAGAKLVLEAGAQISLKAAGAFVDIGPSGITVKGPMVNVLGDGIVNIKGGMVNVNSGGGGGSAASGCGITTKAPAPPETPDAPEEAKLPGQAKAGTVEQSNASPNEKLKSATPTPQLVAFKEASKSGTPLCPV